jgi:hypothetical protein
LNCPKLNGFIYRVFVIPDAPEILRQTNYIMGIKVKYRLNTRLDELPITGLGDPMTTITGLDYAETETVTGAHAAIGNTVRVLYTGKFPDGKVFASSISCGEPNEFVL